MKFLSCLLLLPIVLHVVESGVIPLHKRSAFYIANETACVVDGIVYYNGDRIPTDNPCESCRCRPPGFACVLHECEIKHGCKAIRREGECCPDYLCGCEHNGQLYRNGDEIRDPQNPCYKCHCQGNSIACAFAECIFRRDCMPRFVTGECCPRYDHCPLPAVKTESTTSFITNITTTPYETTEPTTVTPEIIPERNQELTTIEPVSSSQDAISDSVIITEPEKEPNISLENRNHSTSVNSVKTSNDSQKEPTDLEEKPVINETTDFEKDKIDYLDYSSTENPLNIQKNTEDETKDDYTSENPVDYDENDDDNTSLDEEGNKINGPKELFSTKYPLINQQTEKNSFKHSTDKEYLDDSYEDLSNTESSFHQDEDTIEKNSSTTSSLDKKTDDNDSSTHDLSIDEKIQPTEKYSNDESYTTLEPDILAEKRKTSSEEETGFTNKEGILTENDVQGEETDDESSEEDSDEVPSEEQRETDDSSSEESVENLPDEQRNPTEISSDEDSDESTSDEERDVESSEEDSEEQRHEDSSPESDESSEEESELKTKRKKPSGQSEAAGESAPESISSNQEAEMSQQNNAMQLSTNSETTSASPSHSDDDLLQLSSTLSLNTEINQAEARDKTTERSQIITKENVQEPVKSGDSNTEAYEDRVDVFTENSGVILLLNTSETNQPDYSNVNETETTEMTESVSNETEQSTEESEQKLTTETTLITTENPNKTTKTQFIEEKEETSVTTEALFETTSVNEAEITTENILLHNETSEMLDNKTVNESHSTEETLTEISTEHFSKNDEFATQSTEKFTTEITSSNTENTEINEEITTFSNEEQSTKQNLEITEWSETIQSEDIRDILETTTKVNVFTQKTNDFNLETETETVTAETKESVTKSTEKINYEVEHTVPQEIFPKDTSSTTEPSETITKENIEFLDHDNVTTTEIINHLDNDPKFPYVPIDHLGKDSEFPYVAIDNFNAETTQNVLITKNITENPITLPFSEEEPLTTWSQEQNQTTVNATEVLILVSDNSTMTTNITDFN